MGCVNYTICNNCNHSHHDHENTKSSTGKKSYGKCNHYPKSYMCSECLHKPHAPNKCTEKRKGCERYNQSLHSACTYASIIGAMGGIIISDPNITTNEYCYCAANTPKKAQIPECYKNCKECKCGICFPGKPNSIPNSLTQNK